MDVGAHMCQHLTHVSRMLVGSRHLGRAQLDLSLFGTTMLARTMLPSVVEAASLTNITQIVAAAVEAGVPTTAEHLRHS